MVNKTQICATLTATSLQDAVAQMQQAAAAGADVAELRLDLLGGTFDAQNDLQQLLSAVSLPLIVACRPASLGCVLPCSSSAAADADGGRHADGALHACGD